MQHLRNQLNNVKQRSGKSSNLNNFDISADVTYTILHIIREDYGDFNDRSVGVYNSKTGILSIGVKFLGCSFCVSIASDEPDDLFCTNTRRFELLSETIISVKPAFKNNAFDLLMFGPNFDKPTDTKNIQDNLEHARIIYAVIKSEHVRILLDKLKNVKIIGSVDIKLPGSSNYAKQNILPVAFSIIKIFK